MNGKEGTLIRFIPKEQRWCVRCNNNGDDVKAKSENLIIQRNSTSSNNNIDFVAVDDDEDDDECHHAGDIQNHHHRTVVIHNKKKITIPLYWSQDDYVVTLRLGIDPCMFSPENIAVECTGILPYADRYSGVVTVGRHAGKEGEYGSIRFVYQGKKGVKTVLLSESFPGPVHFEKGKDQIEVKIEDRCDVDVVSMIINRPDGKENNDNEQNARIRKFVTLTLPKAMHMPGMSFSWDRLFVGYPGIGSVESFKWVVGVDGDDNVNKEDKDVVRRHASII